ncbi:hypothetical protein [Glaciecola sp. KUL10]|uniref:hypothetical protein n=1 Tax=Glaciecola sp. (strain KUL10) TaxID=2161813 RepID=UPI000D7882EF|nr:hypothetical protein [Glaciecola sp. KUL10]GBL05515.1 hypothetical protein KUL10_28360 [Glaciecola sp. KUL10]
MSKPSKQASKLFYVIFALMISMTSYKTIATDVFVETDAEIGRGLLREIGSTCFVYTPQHVAENSDGFVYVSSPQVRNAEASVLTYFPVDLALLKLPNENREMCSKSSWQDEGNRVNSILGVQKEGILSLREKFGGLSEIAVRFTRKELHSYFYIQPDNSSQQILQGMSGSIIYVGTYPVGMLVSVLDGIGKVLRIDTIANISKTVLDGYATELEKIASTSVDKSAFPSLNKQKKSVEHQPSLSNNAFRGEIAQGQVVEHRFVTRGHTAFKLTHKRQSMNARVNIYVYSPSGKKLGQLGSLQTKNDEYLGFGTVDAGEHTIRIEGSAWVGSYHLTLEEMASPEQLIGEQNIIGDGDSVTGFVAQNTYAEYKFVTRGNTAFKLTHKRQSMNARVNIYVYSPSGKKLGQLGSFQTKNDEYLGFGTVDAGEHTIRIEGSSGVGAYHLTLQKE